VTTPSRSLILPVLTETRLPSSKRAVTALACLVARRAEEGGGKGDNDIVKSPSRLAATFFAIAVMAAVAATGGSAKTHVGSGGTLKVGWESAFGFTDTFDPTGEYLGDAFGIYSDLLVRTLIGYNHVADAAGNALVPDIATTVPAPTNGGTVYIFHLKPGIKFSPPVNRAVTSKDILYAMERLAKPKNGAQYSFYYNAIKGFADYGAGKAKTISGIKTPNDSTIVFTLTTPTGDFLRRMSMPATGPIPQEVAKCFEGQPGKYGLDLVSTAGYMFKGMDNVDASSCNALKPASGFDGQTIMDLVRNPNYNPATDSKAARENLPDEFQFIVNSNADDIYAKIEAGELDMATSTIPPQVLGRYATDASLRPRFHQNSGDRTWYITMNLTQPPFDDIHVRKAFNYLMDKVSLIQAWGGPVYGKVANHIVPDTLFNNQLAEFAPYKTPGDRGSVAKAKAAMKGSKYDTKGDGTCGASVCHNVFLLADTRLVDTKLVPVMQADAKKLGITFKLHTITGAYPTLQTPSKDVPISERPGWGKDYADALTFFTPLFDGRTIIPNGNTNYSLVGLTPAIAKKVGVKGTVSGIPSVSAKLDRCAALIGQPRQSCYENLDKYLMTNVVPWVPYMWSYVIRITSKNVTKYAFDQFSTTPAYAHLAVK
jgi:peptide/nickel transport system substrate-binding protein